MDRSPVRHASAETSYELYRELGEELLTPIEQSVDINVRYELYLSKLIFLENLYEQCFISVNGKSDRQSDTFCASDLTQIQNAIQSTHKYMRETILQALDKRLSHQAVSGREL